jgi:hypothetical protein
MDIAAHQASAARPCGAIAVEPGTGLAGQATGRLAGSRALAHGKLWLFGRSALIFAELGDGRAVLGKPAFGAWPGLEPSWPGVDRSR